MQNFIIKFLNFYQSHENLFFFFFDLADFTQSLVKNPHF